MSINQMRKMQQWLAEGNLDQREKRALRHQKTKLRKANEETKKTGKEDSTA